MAIALVAAGLGLNSTGRGQEFSISWFKIAGGGGTSAGAGYAVSGSIGQPDAGGGMTGGGFEVSGGFWEIVAAEVVPSEPVLSAQLEGGQFLLTWNPGVYSFILESTTTLGPSANWQPVPGATGNSAAVPAGGGAAYFRLRWP
jgi:hypothetical protein